MSFLAAAAIVGGSALVSGYMGSKAAKDAAGIQAGGIDRATAAQQAQFEQTREDYAPYRELGYTALKDIEALKPLLTAQFGPEQMQQYLDPSMEFRRRLGEQTTARALNVGGGLLSGNTLRGLTDYGQNLASTEYANAFNRFQTDRGNIYNTLSNIAGMGMGATNQGAQYGQAAAQNIGQLAVGGAQAQAAGTIGSAQAYQNALGQIGDLATLYGLGKSGFLRPSGAGQPTVTSMFGGGNPIA
jgi:hypothetical protein